MLSEITIKDFAIIEGLTLQFAPGFNVMTGETGAGKSIILDAVSMLLGGRASTEEIRAGASKAIIEGIFVLKEGPVRDAIDAVIEREALEGDAPDVLVLTREVRRDRRNICRVNGRSVTLTLLQEIAEGLVDIHGQSEHLSLFKPAYHLDLLDRYGGLMDERTAFAKLVRALEKTRRELKNLVASEADRAERAELLAYKIEEIEAANMKPGEEDELRAEAKRLANAEQLAESAQAAYRAIHVGREGTSASDLLSEAAGALARLAALDPQMADLAQQAEDLSIEVDELGRTLGDYEDNIEFDPARLQEAELRIDLIRLLKRKYHCETIEALLESVDEAREELDNIEHRDERIEALRAEETAQLARIGEAGAALSKRRKKAAKRLASAVEEELAHLRMEEAKFAVVVEQQEDADGAPVGDARVAFDRTGVDRVAFQIAPNVGEPLKPIARIASGGETSRIMLALKTVLTRADETPTLVFDEIDAGIGGRVGSVVGRKLWSLAGNHQVLVVTHLPQLAGFADEHFKVTKRVEKKRTVTEVAALAHDKRIGELAEMLGAEAGSARQSAAEILSYVESIKKEGVAASAG
jgi:DNA repair protein RecN (Recombination protein N)